MKFLSLVRSIASRSSNIPIPPLRGKALLSAGVGAVLGVAVLSGGVAEAQDRTFLTIQGTGDPEGGRDYIAQGKTYYFTDQTASFTVRPNAWNDYASGIEVSVVQGRYDSWWTLSLAQPGNGNSDVGGGKIVPGFYDNAKRHPFNGSAPGLSLFGDGRGCNQLTGRFIVHEAEYCRVKPSTYYGPNEVLKKLSVTLTQYCDGDTVKPVFATLSYESPTPCLRERPSRDTARAKAPAKKGKRREKISK